jgi:hypothetical protein
MTQWEWVRSQTKNSTFPFGSLHAGMKYSIDQAAVFVTRMFEHLLGRTKKPMKYNSPVPHQKLNVNENHRCENVRDFSPYPAAFALA